MNVELKAELVTENSRLRELCEHWMRCDVLALDTEFVRVSTFYPKAGLVQVGDRNGCYLLDPLVLTEWQPFIELMKCKTVSKILHSCSEDLVLFNRLFACVPEPLFDTQRAAAFLGYGFSISYLNLVLKLKGVTLEKGETRSDWLQRPLSEQQIRYAALDVAYLPELHDILKQQLQEKSLLAFFEGECERLRETAINAEDPTAWLDIYAGMGAAWRLTPAQLGTLKQLCIWREQVARQRDKPRSWVARDADLIALAEKKPADHAALAQIKELNRNLYQQDADQILALISESKAVSRHEADLVEGLPLSQPQRQLLKRCQQQVELISEKTGIAMELLARKKQLVQLLHLNQASKAGSQLQWPSGMQSGWQKPMLAEALEKVLLHEQ